MLRRIFYYALCIAHCALIFSCNKPDNIGLDVLPDSDLTNTAFSDTATILTKTAREDSLRSDELSYVLLGSYTDPVFGTTNVSLYTQMLLTSTPNFGADTSLVADSVVLSLSYTGYYGDTLTPQKFHVYRLNESIYYDSSYYSTRIVGADLTHDLALDSTYSIKPGTSVTVDSVSQQAQLRIHLTKSFADSLLSFNGKSQFENNTNWLNYFQGLYLVPEPVNAPGKGAVLYFDPLSTLSRVTLYYKLSGVKKSYDFSFRSGARINHFQHDTTSIAYMQVSNPSLNDSINYMQSMAGLKVKLEMPYLKHFTDSGKIIINKAELVIKATETSPEPYTVPSELFLAAFDSEGNLNFVIDYSENLFGGEYNVATRSYSFNITRQVQQVLDSKIEDYGYSLVISAASVQSSRLLIGSGKNTGPNKMLLKLYYTRIN